MGVWFDRLCRFAEASQPSNQLFAIAKINQPQKFIVEVSPLKKRESAKKILRTHERTTYMLLTPDAIKKRFFHPGNHASGGTGCVKAPHPRRRHFRTLASDKFTTKQGQTIVIPACWVGPEEAHVGKKKYRVRLDL